MSQFDLIIRGGTVATASDTFSADIAINEGKIAAIGAGLAGADREIDAGGRYVLPGGVDTHAHIEQIASNGMMNADTFETATRSAAFGGTTSVICFACQHRGEYRREQPRSSDGITLLIHIPQLPVSRRAHERRRTVAANDTQGRVAIGIAGIHENGQQLPPGRSAAEVRLGVVSPYLDQGRGRQIHHYQSSP